LSEKKKNSKHYDRKMHVISTRRESLNPHQLPLSDTLDYPAAGSTPEFSAVLAGANGHEYYDCDDSDARER
jgi:hypothetical protein